MPHNLIDLCRQKKVDLIEVESRTVVPQDWEGCGGREMERGWLIGTGVHLHGRNDF
jgi:hypothetical protein